MTWNGILTQISLQRKLWKVCGCLEEWKKLGFDKKTLFDIYQKEIRSILEFAVPVWSSGITNVESNKIEQIQKKVFKLILQSQYHDYETACEKFNTQTLKSRREKLCLKFSKKELKKENSIFERFNPSVINRHTRKKIVKEIACNTERFFNSSLPYLSRLVNADHATVKT